MAYVCHFYSSNFTLSIEINGSLLLVSNTEKYFGLYILHFYVCVNLNMLNKICKCTQCISCCHSNSISGQFTMLNGIKTTQNSAADFDLLPTDSLNKILVWLFTDNRKK